MPPQTETISKLLNTTHVSLRLTGLTHHRLRAVLAAYARSRTGYRTPINEPDGIVVSCEGPELFTATTPRIEPARAADLLAATS